MVKKGAKMCVFCDLYLIQAICQEVIVSTELIDTKVLNRSNASIAFGRVTGCLISNALSFIHVTWYTIALTELKAVIFLHTNGWMPNKFNWCPWKWITHLDVSRRVFPENSMKIIPLWLKGWWGQKGADAITLHECYFQCTHSVIAGKIPFTGVPTLVLGQ